MLKNEPYLQVAEISDRLGFGSPRYFSRCFKTNITLLRWNIAKELNRKILNDLSWIPDKENNI